MAGRRVSLSGQNIYGDALDRLTGSMPNEQSPASYPPPTRKRKTGEQLEKVTLYLTHSQIVALEQEKLRLLCQDGKRVDRSEIVRRLIDTYLSPFGNGTHP